MKKIVFVLMGIMFSFKLCLSQNTKDSILYIGKRGNVVWDRHIQAKHLGKMFYTYYYPIFYKMPVDNQRRWKKIGLLGKRVAPYLTEPKSQALFLKYQHQKLISYIALPVTVSCLAGWAYWGGQYNWKYNRNNPEIGKVIGAYFRPVGVTLLVGYFVSFYGGMYLNTKADLYLKKAVESRNTAYEKGKKTAYISPYISPVGAGITMNF